ncbi:molybdate ABC transporter substrate-binding protein [Rhodococcus sp. 14-2470-1a]|uniref:molybdate ABC transporter substrate-binding protein n=1 Tax=Rhodococcus sp. 14-2470-1a TaxID=2023150 RepID=UPI000B9C5295|nr:MULTISPECIES: molybdate ABC transporter substrate-binding protein [unclassified Rhodococcus (in: high G+C Gram-positive bacteria)]OZE98935.1 molybdate ABC transporter substrate-binding protein [Rhodococcus sp. 15-1154-1]OZF44210.1 molybdate ABC transporter substrate-binding protein [Rhodococcus sp. 14-2470-1a]
MKRSLVTTLVAVGSCAALLSACSNADDSDALMDSTEPTSASESSSGSDVTGDITVFAAASLKATFTELGETFEAEHPGATVEFNFAGSSDLVNQIAQGAPADVFASADTNNMTKAVEGNLVDGDPVDFATNTLTIVTAPGNPENVTSFADLANPDVLTVVCAPQVPCGSATQKVEDATGTTIPAVSEESAVTDVLGKVTSGQADAGLVYVTDAAGAGDQVTAVEFPEASGAVNTYPIVVLKNSDNAATAAAFEALVTGEQGRKVLAEAGFAAP